MAVTIESPWAIEVDAKIPSIIRRWLIDHWSAHVDPRLAVLKLVRLAHCDEPAAAGGPLKPMELAEGRLDWRLDETDGERWRLFIESEGSGCVAESESVEAPIRICCWGLAPQLALYLALTESFRSRGWLSLHASAVVMPGEAVASLFIGRSGAGKSHCLMECLEAGAEPLAEDRLWVHGSEGIVVARDFSVRLLPATAKRFPTLLKGRSSIIDADGKLRYAFADLGFLPAPPTPLGVIRMLSIAGGRADDHPLTRARLLWEAVGRSLLCQGNRVSGEFVQRQIAADGFGN